MEHRSPRLPEFTLSDYSLDAIPIDKRDLFLFLNATKTLGDEESERLLSQALEIAALVDDMVGFYRHLERDIRRTEKEASQNPEAAQRLQHLYGGRLNIFSDADTVSQYFREHRIGKYFPRTRRRISRRIAWLLSKTLAPKTPKKPETLSESPSKPIETSFSLPEMMQQTVPSPLRFAQPPGKIDLSTDTLKTLRAKYSKIYHKN